MQIRHYTDEQINLAKRFISPDAFFYIICNALSRKQPLSAVGFGDGEKAVMNYSKGMKKAHYLDNEQYLKEYGIYGADLKKIGEELFLAAEESDFFCPLISGVSMEAFDVIRMSDKRLNYVERLFPYMWYYAGRVDELMKHKGIALVCRNAKETAKILEEKYKCEILPIEYDSHKDTIMAYTTIGYISAGLILCATGQSGKYMMVNAAKDYNKVVLDIGSALKNKWINQ